MISPARLKLIPTGPVTSTVDVAALLAGWVSSAVLPATTTTTLFDQVCADLRTATSAEASSGSLRTDTDESRSSPSGDGRPGRPSMESASAPEPGDGEASFAVTRSPTSTSVSVALVSQGVRVATVHLRRGPDRPWSASQLQELQQLATAAAAILAMVHDRTESRCVRSRLTRPATHDLLTGLPYRALLLDRLQHALDAAGRGDGCVGALFVDVDEFELINDTVGHAAGDRVLTEVGRRLQGSVRAGDSLARLGGDEFVIVCENLDSLVPQAIRQMRTVARRLQQELRRPARAGEADIFVSASVGAGLTATPRTTTAPDLLATSDLARFDAQRRGRGRIAARLHEPETSGLGTAGRAAPLLRSLDPQNV